MSVFLLTTDTFHHRYFINRLIGAGIKLDKIYFENKCVVPKFPIGPFFEDEIRVFEEYNFFQNVSYELKGLDISNIGTVNDDSVVSELSKLKPNFGIVFGTGKIKLPTIQKFRDGLINIHRGIAQYYRGLDSDLWACYHNDFENIGTTIHMVDKRLDTGNIVGQSKVKMKKDMKIFQLRYYTTVIATDLVIKILNNYTNMCLSSKPQEKIGRYYSFMPLVLKYVIAEKFEKYCRKLK